MNFLSAVTVLVLTYDEAPNIGRTLEALGRFLDVVVLDSGSTDQTLAIAARYPNVRVMHRPFDSQSGQWTHGLTACGIKREWVLALDADYLLSPDLIDEIAVLAPPPSVSGYRVSFRYCVFGKPLSKSLYPPAITLYRRCAAHYVQDGHTQRVVVSGGIRSLGARIHHDDRKSLARWLSAQAKYAVQEAELLSSTPWRHLRLQDKIRKLVIVAPWLVPLYCLTVGRGLLDGWAGLFYALQRGVAESIIAIQLLEHRLRDRP